MEKVKQFIEDFIKAEAKMLNLKYGTDISAYNAYLPKYYAYFIKRLNYAMGHMDRNAEEEAHMDEILEMTEEQKIDTSSSPLRNPRHFLKLSQYKHDIYGDVWVAYVSGESPDLDFIDLTRAFFVIKEDEKFAIARFYSYSKARTNGLKYKWDGREGYKDLTFKSLKGPDKIERYLEPDEMFDGLINYHAEM